MQVAPPALRVDLVQHLHQVRDRVEGLSLGLRVEGPVEVGVDVPDPCLPPHSWTTPDRGVVGPYRRSGSPSWRTWGPVTDDTTAYRVGRGPGCRPSCAWKSQPIFCCTEGDAEDVLFP